MRDSLQKFFQSFGEKDTHRIVNRLLGEGQTETAHARQIIFAQGEPLESLYFMDTGVVRYFTHDIEGNQTTKSLRLGPTFLFSVKALSEKGNYFFSAESISSIELLKVQRSVWDQLVAENHGFSRFYSQFLESLFVEKEQRELDLLTLSAEERLGRFRSQFADYLHEIPKGVAASFIGVKPETYSRLLKSSSQEP